MRSHQLLLVLLGVHVASGLNKPEAFYDECVKWTNAMRAREGLPAMGRWTRGEACLDSMATFDASKKEPTASGRNPTEFKDCLVAPGALDAATERVTSMACLGSLDDKDSIRKCLTSYWMYKGTVSAYTYENMRGGSTKTGKYNRYDKMSCGFGVGSDGTLYISQGFHGPYKADDLEFKCGGCGATQPCKVPPFGGVPNPTVPDCSVPGNYSGCDVDYSYLGCSQVGCDASYEGPCENVKTTLAVSNTGPTQIDPCARFKVTDAKQCASSGVLTDIGGGKHTYKFAEYCRPLCKTCACTAANKENQPNPCTAEETANNLDLSKSCAPKPRAPAPAPAPSDAGSGSSSAPNGKSCTGLEKIFGCVTTSGAAGPAAVGVVALGSVLFTSLLILP